MDRRSKSSFTLFLLMTIAITSPIQTKAGEEQGRNQLITSGTPFTNALDTLQKNINYTFQRIDLLRRAMTHASFSQENNRALSVLGTSIIDTAVSLQYLLGDIDVSSKTLNRKIAEVSNVESCAADGLHLGLHKVIRLSQKTNSTSPVIVCGAFRAIFGAIALDTGNSDVAGKVFRNVHSGPAVVAAEM